MANTIRDQKEAVVSEIKEKIQKCTSFVVIDYKGLTVLNDTAFRREMRDSKVEYKVLKNTMVRIALHELGYKEFDASLNGPTAVAFSYDDPVTPVKIAAANIKKLNKMQIKCGMIDRKFTDGATMVQIANVPPKPVLLSMLANVLQAPIRGLAVTVDQIAQQRQAQ